MLTRRPSVTKKASTGSRKRANEMQEIMESIEGGPARPEANPAAMVFGYLGRLAGGAPKKERKPAGAAARKRTAPTRAKRAAAAPRKRK